MNKNSIIEAELSDSSEEVIKTIQELSEFINEISNIGSEIELISLNASVKAAHTGEEGAALGVLAEAIQKLSIQAKQETGVVIEKLEAIKSLSAQLHDTNNQSNLLRENTGLKSVFEKIKSITQSLEQIVKSAEGDLNGIHKEAVALESDMKKIVGNNNAQLEFENMLNKAMNKLENLICDECVGKNYTKPINLNEISSKYTMQVQRDIHNSIINKKDISKSPLNTHSVSSSGEFGNNVDLF
jgi:methyl-accepting chemotaxis protein